MADEKRAGGAWRRDKKGNLTQLEEPAESQALGAHEVHPAKAEAAKAAPGSGKKSAAESQPVKEQLSDENA